MAKSSIEWTDETWNPVTGCTRVSSGCDHCYAVSMTNRLEAMGQEKYSGLVNLGKGHFNGVVKTHEDALLIPLKAKKGRRWFVNSMSDLFHKDVPFEFIDKVFAIMALCPQHTFQVLTKRPERAAEYFAAGWVDSGHFFSYADSNKSGWINKWLREDNSAVKEAWARLYKTKSRLEWPLDNVWIGTSVEDQATADERIPHLLKVPAKVRFLSCEPLLGRVALSQYLVGYDPDGAEMLPLQIHQVIAGGESGPNARPMHPDFARSLRDQCEAAGVAYFFKQFGEWTPDFCESMSTGKACGRQFANKIQWINKAQTWMEPGDICLDANGVQLTRGAHFDTCAYPVTVLRRLGKKRAGRLLDGKEHNAFPEVA